MACGLQQVLLQLLEMKSTDRKQTLLHYLVKVIAEKYPQLTGFHSDLHFLDKAGSGMDRGIPSLGWGRGSALGTDVGWEKVGELQDVTGQECCFSDLLPLYCPIPHSVSLDSVLGDVRSLQRGLELTQREFVRQDDCMVLKEFLRANSPIMDKLLADSKTAQVGWGWSSSGGGEAGVGMKEGCGYSSNTLRDGAGGPTCLEEQRQGGQCLKGVQRTGQDLKGPCCWADRLCAPRRPMSLWWSTSVRTPRPRPLPCSSPFLAVSSRPIRYVCLVCGLGPLQGTAASQLGFWEGWGMLLSGVV